MHRVFPSHPAPWLLLAALCGCDRNMSDMPLPGASAEEVSRVAARVAKAPSLSVPAGQTISGVIELAPRVASLTAPSDVVFVMARDPASKGPPLAVERLTGNVYPMRFVLDSGTVMMPGAALTSPVQLVVKVDKDGDANTSAADDLIGFTPDPVRPGEAGVRVAIEGTLGELARAAEQDEGTGEAGERAGAAAPMTPGPAGGEAARPAGGPARVVGTIVLAPELAGRTSSGAVLFVIAREPGKAGPPVAVARLVGNRFPMAFRLDDSNLMLRESWPAALELEARLDADGDPLTRDAGDLTGRLAAPIPPGQTDVRIQLEGSE
ncbi:MAG TPA: hypothetical protein VIC59_06315 [Gemmatimonadota bacterium]